MGGSFSFAPEHRRTGAVLRRVMKPKGGEAAGHSPIVSPDSSVSASARSVSTLWMDSGSV